MAKVYGAMALCRAKWPFSARASVIRMNGTTTTARMVCEISSVKYSGRDEPLPLEMGDAGAQHQMVVEIRDQEQRGGDERRQHHPLVRLRGGRA